MIKFGRVRARRRINAILESEANESGAVALGILLALHGRHVGLTTLKNDCGVTRDGTTPAKLQAAARLHGLQCQRLPQPGPESLLELERAGRLPAIIHTEDNRYIVLVRCRRDGLELFDTALGSLRMQPDQMRASEILLMEPGEDFHPQGHPPSIWAVLLKLISPFKAELALLVLIASASVIPLLMIAGCTSQFIDAFLQQQRLSFGLPILWLSLIAVALWLLLSQFRDLMIRRLSHMLTRSFAADMFEYAFSADFPYYLQRSSSELAGRLSFAMDIPNLVVNRCGSACLQLWTGVLLIAFSSLISPVLFLLLLAGFILAIAYAAWIVQRLSVNNDILTAEGNQAAAKGIEAIANIESVKSSGLEFTFLREFQSHYLEGIRQSQIIGKQAIKTDLSVNGSIFAMTAILLGVGGLLIIQGSLSLGALLAFLFLQSQINNVIYQIPKISNSWQKAQGKLRRYHDLTTASPDPYLRGFSRRSDLPLETKKLAGRIELENVRYAFSPVDEAFICDLNLQVSAGEHLALVGSSGSGKSTIIRMLAGFYRPSSGHYRIAGREWMTIPDLTIRSSLAYVPQDVFVFNTSFEDNIKLWRPNFSHADVVRAAIAAGLHDDIMNYGESYNTIMKDNGTNLSGGQRQRIEIARALIQQPTILLLDEATSALDNRTEEHVLAALKQLGITVITVAHRLNAALQSDQVIVLDEGKVVEQGHPTKLLASQGAFHRLVQAEAQRQAH